MFRSDDRLLVRVAVPATLVGVLAAGLVLLIGLPGPAIEGVVTGTSLEPRQVENTLKVAAAVGAAGVALGALGRYEISRASARLDLTRSRDERYVAAADLLRSKEQPGIISGVYALEQLGEESSAHRLTIVRVLESLVREQCRHRVEGEVAHPWERTPEAAYAALRVFSRTNWSPLNLQGVNLAGAFLDDIQLPNANLMRANLDGVVWARGSLQGANLNGATMTGGKFSNVDFSGANLRWAVRTDAVFAHCNLRNVGLEDGAEMPG